MDRPKNVTIDIQSMVTLANEIGLEVRTGVPDSSNQTVHHFKHGHDVVMFKTSPVITGVTVGYYQAPVSFEGGHAWVAQNIRPHNQMFDGLKNPSIHQWLTALIARFAPPVRCDSPTHEEVLVPMPLPSWTPQPRHGWPRQVEGMPLSTNMVTRKQAKEALENFFRQASDHIENWRVD